MSERVHGNPLAPQSALGCGGLVVDVGQGGSTHAAVPAVMARIETRIALWTAIHRLPDLALAVSADQLPWKSDHRQHALTALPVTFTPQPTT